MRLRVVLLQTLLLRHVTAVRAAIDAACCGMPQALCCRARLLRAMLRLRVFITAIGSAYVMRYHVICRHAAPC